MKYLFYQGCTTPQKENAYEVSFRKIASKLDIELVPLEEQNCCGFFVNPVDHFASLIMAARNLALFDAAGLDAITPCPACFGHLTKVRNELLADKKLADEVNEILQKYGKKFTGVQKIRHLVNVLIDEIGMEKIKATITRPLANLKVAPHYGCHVLKPSYEVNTDDPENPELLDALVAVTGAKILDYSEKKLCCGSTVANADEALSIQMTKTKLESVRKAGADAIVTLCPACHMQLDLVAGAKLREISLPVLHYTQLLGLAQGFSAEELAFGENRIDTERVVELALSPPVISSEKK